MGAAWFDTEHRSLCGLSNDGIYYKFGRSTRNIALNPDTFIARMDFSDHSDKRRYADCWARSNRYRLRWSLCLWPGKLIQRSISYFLLRCSDFLIARQVYCGEIADKSIRGKLGSFYQLMITAGILVGYILGWLLSARTASLICGIIPIVFGVCIFFCPESPTYLVSNNETVAFN